MCESFEPASEIWNKIFSTVVANRHWKTMGKCVGAVPALEYVMEGNFGERYGKKISESSQKIKLLISDCLLV